MKNLVCPKTINQLNAVIPVLGDMDTVHTGCILDVTSSGIIELVYYENFAEKEEMYVGELCYDNFDKFVRTLKKKTKKRELYIASDYAAVLLAKLNGGKPQDYIQ